MYSQHTETKEYMIRDAEHYDSLAGTVKEKNPMEQAIERMKNRDE